MYLRRKKYIGAEYEHRGVTGKVEIKINGKELPIDFNKISYIEESVCYWRKANAIHRWFVNNAQDGVDDCRNAYVGLEDLQKLLDVCKKTKENHDKAQELLPTQEGFFFGSTEYDEWYFNDIDYTIEKLEEIIKEEKEMNELGFYSEFEYHSSW